MSFCQNCGTELAHDVNFCPNCGAENKGADAAAPASDATVASATTTVPGDHDATTEYKGIGIRLVAHIVDAILVFIVYFIVGSMIAGATGGATEEGFELRGGPAFLLMLVTFVVSMAYFIILESKWSGQTLGKKMVGIRVAGENGGAASIRQTTIRNLLRLVDVLPFLYIVGMILIWTSDKRQRLGDRVAETVVVRASKTAAGEERTAGKKARVKFSMGKGSDFLDT